MESPEHEALDDPAAEDIEAEDDQDPLGAEDAEESAGAPEAPTGP